MHDEFLDFSSHNVVGKALLEVSNLMPPALAAFSSTQISARLVEYVYTAWPH